MLLPPHKVALEADVDMDCAVKVLRVLLWHKCIALLDLFRYSNVYRYTTERTKLRYLACEAGVW